MRAQVVNGPELMTAVLGESEAAVKATYIAARAIAPTVVFIDEVDAFAPARSGMAATGGGDASGTASRVLATLLIEMQGGASGSATECDPCLYACFIYVLVWLTEVATACTLYETLSEAEINILCNTSMQ